MKSKNCSPIGLFDSGVGGWSVLNAVHELMPHESLIYVADSAFAPYGDKSPKQIIERSFSIVDFLVGEGCKAIVVACNTATAAAISHLRDHYQVPIIGVEPGIKPAVEQSLTGRVGVMATQYTVESEKFQHLLSRFENKQIVIQPCPGLVELIEAPETLDQQLLEYLSSQLSSFRREGIDTLALGCTHYGFVLDQIKTVLGEAVRIIDTPSAVARELKRRLDSEDLVCEDSTCSVQLLTTSEDLVRAQNRVEKLLKRDWVVTHQSIGDKDAKSVI